MGEWGQATFLARLRDKSVEDSASLPSPDVLAEEIVEDLRAALEQFEEIGTDLKFPQP